MAKEIHSYTQRRKIWPPEPGFFSLRLVKDAWRVPARIICENGLWRAEVDDILHPVSDDPAQAYMVDAIWHHGIKIPEDVYQWMYQVREWAAHNCPDHPCLFPRRAIDPAKLAPIPPSLSTERGHQNG
jgi:hypothetical protein